MNIKEAVNTLHELIDDIHFALSMNEDKGYVNNIYEMENTISEYVENHEMPFITGLTITASTSDEVPIAEYAPVKRGRWVYKDTCGKNTGAYHCSICNKIPRSGRWEKYCPNCGARMEAIEKVISEGHSETKVWEEK